ncbi:uncharacterized protein BKCO1_27000121 [Diplodia corticola]|uniref:Uncharacterized protein n=1 Tax=Diplodia corticola TaxID=236234 RepID=A0A1J9RMQ0_9PEZI|nr:uncharacterized protein BKCO1_27000121 [Diplodia corticola]OJD33851.1 hypothetical protein BKCO1_27000121 [Diplodia corticola]
MPSYKTDRDDAIEDLEDAGPAELKTTKKRARKRTPIEDTDRDDAIEDLEDMSDAGPAEPKATRKRARKRTPIEDTDRDDAIEDLEETSDAEHAEPKATKKRAQKRTPIEDVVFIAVVGVPVGRARTPHSLKDKGKDVWATLGEDNNVLYRINGGKRIATDEIEWSTTFDQSDMMGRLEANRKLANSLKEAWYLDILSEEEVKEVQRDPRLTNVAFAICGFHKLLTALPPMPAVRNLVPNNFLAKRRDAQSLLDKLKDQYTEFAPTINAYAAARAAGYMKVFEKAFPNGFFDIGGNNSFHLDIYVMRACARFWGSSRAGKPHGYAKRMIWDDDDGFTGFAKELSRQMESTTTNELVKPRFMTQQWMKEKKPVFVSKYQVEKLEVLSLIFSTLSDGPPKTRRILEKEYNNPLNDKLKTKQILEIKARKNAESGVFCGPVVPTPGWREILEPHLAPGEIINFPSTNGVPSFGEATMFPLGFERRLKYYEYIKKLSGHQSMALGVVLAALLKESLDDEREFDKWAKVVDDCLEHNKFQIPKNIWKKVETLHKQAEELAVLGPEAPDAEDSELEEFGSEDE